MTNRSKMILGLASLLGVTAGATAVSGFAWFVTTKTAIVDVTNIGIYNNNPSLSVTLNNLHGVTKVNDVANDFDLRASKDTTYFSEEALGDGTTKAFTLTSGTPNGAPKAYVEGVLTPTTYNSNTKTVTFTGDAPAASAKILFEYCEAALTDISSKDGINFYDPTWMAAYEGRKATKVPGATAGQQYISFDMVFAGLETGSLDILLDRPTITAKSAAAADVEAAAVARVAFAIGGSNVLMLSKNTGDGYNKGISKAKVESYPGDPDYNNGVVSGAENDPERGKNAYTTAGDYTVKALLDTCGDNLVTPSETNYSVLSSTPGTDPDDMFICTVGADPVTVSVTIWLEGTSHVDEKGNNSTPIGGEISVKLPVVAFNH